MWQPATAWKTEFSGSLEGCAWQDSSGFVLFCSDDVNDEIESMLVKLVGCSKLGGATGTLENQMCYRSYR